MNISVKLRSFFGVFIMVLGFSGISSPVAATNHPSWHWESYYSNYFGRVVEMVVDDRCTDGTADAFSVTVYSGQDYTDHKAEFCGYVDLLSDFPISPTGTSWNDKIRSACLTFIPSGKALQFAADRDQQGAKDRWIGQQCWPSLGEFDKRYSSFKRIVL